MNQILLDSRRSGGVGRANIGIRALDAKARRRRKQQKKEEVEGAADEQSQLEKSFRRVSAYSCYSRISIPMCLRDTDAEKNGSANPVGGEDVGDEGEVDVAFTTKALTGSLARVSWNWKTYNNEVLHFFLLSQDVDIFVYDYGCIVFWGFDAASEMKFIDSMALFSEGRRIRTQEEMQEMSDIMHFTFREEAEEDQAVDAIDASFQGRGTEKDKYVSIKNDRIILRSRDRLLKLSLSFSMAQSCQMFTFEDMISATIEDTRPLPDNLRRHGTFKLSQKEIRMFMGRIYQERCKVTLYSDLLEVPQYFWEDDM